MSARESKFWSMVEKSDGCWRWLGRLSEYGYGHIQGGGRSPIRAHRFAYELLVGPVPDGLVLDHLCRNRACVNPEHLEPVTNAVNVLRGEGPTAQLARRTHCNHGHEFTPENTGVRHDGYRKCRACIAAYSAANNARRRSNDRAST